MQPEKRQKGMEAREKIFEEENKMYTPTLDAKYWKDKRRKEKEARIRSRYNEGENVQKILEQERITEFELRKILGLG